MTIVQDGLVVEACPSLDKNLNYGIIRCLWRSVVGFLITVLRWLLDLLTVVIIVDVFVSYFLDYYHPVRRTLDRIVQPLLAPLRRYVPPVAGIDLSPVLLIFIIQLFRMILLSL